MTEPKTCTVGELLAGFAKLSPEDQERVRAELGQEEAADQVVSCCDPAAMMEQMMGRMKATGCDPMAMGKEMMGKTRSPEDEESAAPSDDGKEGCC